MSRGAETESHVGVGKNNRHCISLPDSFADIQTKLDSHLATKASPSYVLTGIVGNRETIILNKGPGYHNPST
jgi:hypothetical protein